MRYSQQLASLLMAWIVIFGLDLTTDCALGQSLRQKAKDSLRGDWYDRSTESYRPPRMVEAVDHPLRKSGRLASPSKAWNWDWNFPNWNLGLGGLSTASTYTILAALVFLLLACLVLLIWHFSGGIRSPSDRRQAKGISIDPARIEDLPFAVDQMSVDPLAQARLRAEAGDYDKAVIYVYCYLLLALDQAGKIYLQKGKTNRMYLRELNGLSELQEILSQAVLKFEQTYFGRIRLSRQDFEALWSELDRFHRLLQTTPVDQFQVELNPAPN